MQDKGNASPRVAGLRRPVVAAVVVALLGAVGWVLWGVLNPAPPSVLIMATGPEGSAYERFAAHYRTILASSGVELRLQPTAGAVENLVRLRDPRSGVSVGFAQTGTTTPEESPTLASLGTVFYEPMWLFYRGLDASKGFAALRGRRLSIGPEGSGTRVLALRLLALADINPGTAELLPLLPEEAMDRLSRGEIDAAAILTSWESPVVQQLLNAPGVALASFPRADAVLALNPYLSKLVLPAGVADLGRNLPPADVVLVASKASLVVRRDLHPALQYLLLEAASEIHSRPGIFHQAGEFPAPEAIDLPLTEEARQFDKSGRPFLQRHLPFWLAARAERLLFLLVPLLGIAYPLLRALPSAYEAFVRNRIAALYGELKLVEVDLEKRASADGVTDLHARLDALEYRADHLHVSTLYAVLLYTLKDHIRLVRDGLEKGT